MSWRALGIAFAAGWLALSYEILWFRVYSFLTGGTAGGFAVVLGVYLLGIAGGSVLARRACGDDGRLLPSARQVPALLVAAATLASWMLIPGLAELVRHWPYPLTFPWMALCSGLLGAVLPLVAHTGVHGDEAAGEGVSRIYLANIFGSTAGSLLTGFVLLELLPLPAIAALLAAAGWALAAALAAPSASRKFGWAACAAMAVATGAASPLAYDCVYEKLLYKNQWVAGQRFAHVVENRSGVITVSADDRVYGSGMYDGVYNVNLHDDRNLTIRAYLLAGLRERYPEVLMVGLASASWAQVVANNPGVGKLTVIEINHGYAQLAEQYPQVRSVLHNPKVDIIYDDGRRWLRAHPERKFDLIVQNTTWYWRSYASNLLSAEYHEVVKAHLQPGGIDFFNATGSPHVYKTACTAFSHGLRVYNFFLGSQQPLHIDRDLWRRRLLQYQFDGQPLFDLSQAAHRRRLDEVLRLADDFDRQTPGGNAERCVSLLGTAGSRPVITDDNMAVEWLRPWHAVPVAGD